MDDHPRISHENKATEFMLNQALCCLKYSADDAQYLAMMILRNFGYEVIGHDYWENFYWTVVVDNKEWRIDPNHKEKNPNG
jgi:hypothetical protein